jgi:hypothetical protein
MKYIRERERNSFLCQDFGTFTCTYVEGQHGHWNTIPRRHQAWPKLPRVLHSSLYSEKQSGLVSIFRRVKK